MLVGAAIMDTDRMLHNSSSSSHHQLNSSMDHSPPQGQGQQGPPPVGAPTPQQQHYPPLVARKKKSDRIIAPQLNLSEAGLVMPNGQSPYGQVNHYSNDSASLGNMNHGFAQDTSAG